MNFANFNRILAVSTAMVALCQPFSAIAANGDLMVNGNVGVGTTTPQARVDVAGDIQWGTNKGVLSTFNGNASVGTVSNAPLLLTTNGMERLRIDANGRIGIGVTSPSHRVQILESRTDPTTWYSSLTSGHVITTTSTGSHIGLGGVFSVTSDVNSGTTNNGYIVGLQSNANRYRTTDVGVLNSLMSSNSIFGHSDPTNRWTNDAYGHAIYLMNSGGTINTAYALFITEASTGGTINKRYGVYVSDPLMTNVFMGNVGIGTNTPSYKLHVNGSFAATSKNFDIPDPRYNDDKRRLVHSSLEGPESAVYYRGEVRLKNGRAKVDLPAYFEALTHKEKRTVLLTPAFESDDESLCAVAASAVKDGSFSIKAYSVSDPSVCNHGVYWEVKAERSDIESLKVELTK